MNEWMINLKIQVLVTRSIYSSCVDKYHHDLKFSSALQLWKELPHGEIALLFVNWFIVLVFI